MLSLAEARDACLHWQAIREHSRAELVHKLQYRDFDDEVINQALDRLAEEGLQSDRRFLESWVRSRYAKGQGAQRIRQELKARGISGEDLERCLAEYDWDELLEQVNQKKYADSRPATLKEYSARLRFLSQRGFEQDRIQALMRRLRRGDD
jgi:regulatory protein